MPVVLVPGFSKWRAMADSRVTRRRRASPANVKLDFLDDLGNVPVPQFVESLKNAYSSDKARFYALSRKLTNSLENSPDPGPCTFVARCLQVLLAMGPPYNETVGYLVTRSLGELDVSFKPDEDVNHAKKIAAEMFTEAINGATLDSRFLVRLVLALEMQISDVAQAQAYDENDEANRLQVAKSSIESFILNLVKKKSYSSAVSLLKHFGLQECTSQDFLVAMLSAGQWDLAGRWASFLGKDNLVFLVEQCRNMELYKIAYRLVKCYDLEQEFPDAFYAYRRSSLRKLVAKGIWDVAESIAGDDRILQEYLIMLALGRNEVKRAEAFCDAFQLEDYDLSAVEITEVETPCDYLQLDSLLELEKVIWIDKAAELGLILDSLPGVNIIGIDGEWKANRIKGEEPNKVSILQVATEHNVFVLDLLNLSNDAPEKLNHCVESIFASQRILKLGFGIHNDLDRLAQSYPHLKGFRSCTMFLDLECFPEKRSRGGLSGLTKSLMGNHLDKSVRMSDWSKRPLTNDQIIYAALDAAILLPLHLRICSAHSITDDGRSSAKNWRVKT